MLGFENTGSRNHEIRISDYEFNNYLGTFSELEASAAAGCDCCGLLRAAFLRTYGVRFESLDDFSSPVTITNMRFVWKTD